MQMRIVFIRILLQVLRRKTGSTWKVRYRLSAFTDIDARLPLIKVSLCNSYALLFTFITEICMDDNSSDQQKLWDMIKDIKFGMFTHRHTDGRLHSVPLTTQNRSLDEASTLYFFCLTQK